MGHLIKKGKIVRFHTGIGKLAAVGILVTFSAALVDTIWAIYLESYFHNPALTGFFSAFLTFVSFVSFFLLVPIIEKNDKEKLFIFALAISILSYIAFSFFKGLMGFMIIATIYILAISIRISSFGIIVKDQSEKKELARNEGIMYTAYNSGWFIGPLIAGFIASRYSYPGIFLSAAALLFIALFLFTFFKIQDHNIKKSVDKKPLKNLIDFFKNKDRAIAYFVGGGISFWWVLIYLFAPILMIERGLGITHVSIFLFLVVIPNISLSYFFSKIASKNGFKKIFIIGYSILAICALLAFLSTNILNILLFCIIASIGAAMIEPTGESYFLDILKGKEVYRFYSEYNTTIDVNHFIAKFMPALILLILPFKFVFLFFSIFMIFFAFLSLFTKNIVEDKSKRLNKK